VQTNPNVQVETMLQETEALETALNQVERGGLVVIFPESVGKAIEQIQKRNPIE